MICSRINSITLADDAIFKGIASTHLVKLSVATNTNLCPLLDDGNIWPIRSIPHPLNGHGFTIGFIVDAGDF